MLFTHGNEAESKSAFVAVRAVEVAEFSAPLFKASIAVVVEEIPFRLLKPDRALQVCAHAVPIICDGRPQPVELPMLKHMECLAFVIGRLHGSPPFLPNP